MQFESSYDLSRGLLRFVTKCTPPVGEVESRTPMSHQDTQPSTHRRFRRFVVWYTAILGGFSTMLLGSIVLIAYVFDGNLALYIDKFGEAGLELLLFALIAGTVPFGLFVLDEFLRVDGE